MTLFVCPNEILNLRCWCASLDRNINLLGTAIQGNQPARGASQQ